MTANPTNDRPLRPRFAYRFPGAYHGHLMAQPWRRIGLTLLVVFALAGVRPARAADTPSVSPLPFRSATSSPA